MALQAANFWRHRPVLITGCTGVLGSWLTERLVALGARVVGLVRDQVPDSHLCLSGHLDRIVVVRGSVTDYPTLLRALNEYEVETCFHLAAQTVVNIAQRAPMATFETNIQGVWTVLEAARHTPTLRRLVVASSDKAYGTQPELPYVEDNPLHGRFPYDVSKACADLVAQAYHASYGLPVTISRCGNLYGGGDLNFNRVIPGTIRSLYYDEDPTIRSDGTMVRDYLYIRDAVDAYLILAERMEDPTIHGLAFNFSPEQPIAVLPLVELLIRLAGKPDRTPRIMAHGPLPGEIPAQYLCSARARQLLGWQPYHSLEAGLRETLDWYAGYFKWQKARWWDWDKAWATGWGPGSTGQITLDEST